MPEGEDTSPREVDGARRTMWVWARRNGRTEPGYTKEGEGKERPRVGEHQVRKVTRESTAPSIPITPGRR